MVYLDQKHAVSLISNDSKFKKMRISVRFTSLQSSVGKGIVIILQETCMIIEQTPIDNHRHLLVQYL